MTSDWFNGFTIGVGIGMIIAGMTYVLCLTWFLTKQKREEK